MRCVIVTGMSGAGKSTALKMLEDMGYFCVDNLPVPLIPKMAELLSVPGTEINKAALGVDIRSGQNFYELKKILKELDRSGTRFEILYLESSDDVLIKRYKETRRFHPLSGKDGRVEEGIKEERKRLEFLRERADYLIDSSHMLTRELRDQAGSAGSDWFAFDVARMGNATEEQRAAYLARLQDAVEAVYANKEDSMMRLRISDIHRMALTVIACGGDPENFGTDPDGNPINLIHDTVWNSNSCWGDPGDQGINGYIWALLTIDAKNYQEPEGAEWTREKLVSELLSRQLADGGFGLIKTDPSDVDLTSMVLTALAPYRGQDKTYTYTGIISGQEETSTVDAVAEKAFARLSELQADDGSMLTYDERTSESTAWAMIALASWGRDPEQDGAFMKKW